METSQKKRRSESISRSIKKTYYPLVGVKFRRVPPKDWVYPALDSASRQIGVSMQEYCRVAVEEKLIKEGYRSSDIPTE